MPHVGIEDLKPGMKMAKPVVTDNGLILYGEGTEITETIIERLRARSIDKIFVEGSSQPAQTKEEMLAALQSRFRKTGGEPHMETLKKLFEEHIKDLYK